MSKINFMLKKIILFILGSLLSLGGVMPLTLTSSAFAEAERIPMQYTCDGVDHSPPLAWHNVPRRTQSFLLIMDDPDAPAGVWDHWVLYNIPATTHALPENIQTLPLGTQTGINSWRQPHYNGPCPPDREHRYYFKLYALDTLLELHDGATKEQVEAAMRNHVITTAELMGRYERLRK
jgi:Raf kinase inhibitor-like YbhB/YbcL family protein